MSEFRVIQVIIDLIKQKVQGSFSEVELLNISVDEDQLVKTPARRALHKPPHQQSRYTVNEPQLQGLT